MPSVPIAGGKGARCLAWREDGQRCKLTDYHKREAIKHRNQRDTFVEIGPLHRRARRKRGVISTLRVGFITMIVPGLLMIRLILLTRDRFSTSFSGAVDRGAAQIEDLAN